MRPEAICAHTNLDAAEGGVNSELARLVGLENPVPLEVDGTDATVTWSSSDSKIATVDASGVVTAVSSGKATITASVEGQTLTIEVLVW